MKSEWKEVRLGDICKTNASSYSNKENWKYINYLDTGNITQNKIDNIVHLNCETDKIPSRAKRKVKEGDIIYSNVRPNQFHYGLMKNIPSNFLVSTGFTTISVNEDLADNKFIYYYIIQESIIQKLQSIAEQSVSAYPSIKPSDLEELTIKIPVKVSEQKAISSILSALDDKIAFNQQINNNLEQQAQAIYQQMFIDNDEFEKWEKGILGDIADITMGQSPKGSSYNENNVGTVFFQGRAEFGHRFPTIRLYTTEPKRMANKNDILMSVRAPVGDINVAHEECCIGRGLAAIHSKGNYQSFMLYTMYALKNKLDVFNGEGTVFGSINKDALNSLPVNIPPFDNIKKFEDIVSPMDEMIRTNYDEIQRLTSIRDSLLPKLMNGEIDINGI